MSSVNALSSYIFNVYAQQQSGPATGVTTLVDKGDSLLNQGNYPLAIQYFDKAIAIDPNYKVALNEKGAALYGLGNYPQAIQYFDKALAIDPNYKEALDNRQATLSKMGNVSSSANVGGS